MPVQLACRSRQPAATTQRQARPACHSRQPPTPAPRHSPPAGSVAPGWRTLPVGAASAATRTQCAALWRATSAPPAAGAALAAEAAPTVDARTAGVPTWGSLTCRSRRPAATTQRQARPACHSRQPPTPAPRHSPPAGSVAPGWRTLPVGAASAATRTQCAALWRATSAPPAAGAALAAEAAPTVDGRTAGRAHMPCSLTCRSRRPAATTQRQARPACHSRQPPTPAPRHSPPAGSVAPGWRTLPVGAASAATRTQCAALWRTTSEAAAGAALAAEAAPTVDARTAGVPTCRAA